MSRVLVTGFRPFLGAQMNPSEFLAHELALRMPQVEPLILPVEFKKSFEILRRHVEERSYSGVVMLGQAADRSRICLEKIALNWVQTENADEGGQHPSPGPISEGAPLARMSRFPVDEIYTALRAENQPVSLSFSAGTFVCNDLYFRVTEELRQIPSIFVHVPVIAEGVSQGSPLPGLNKEVQLHTLTRFLQIWLDGSFSARLSGL